MAGIRGASFEDLLQALSASKPTRQSVEALLKVHAPALARVFEAGWTDAEIVEAFLKDGENGSDSKELVRLLHMARKQERAGIKRVKRTRQWRSPPKSNHVREVPQNDQVATTPTAESRRKPRARGV